MEIKSCINKFLSNVIFEKISKLRFFNFFPKQLVSYGVLAGQYGLVRGFGSRAGLRGVLDPSRPFSIPKAGQHIVKSAFENRFFCSMDIRLRQRWSAVRFVVPGTLRRERLRFLTLRVEEEPSVGDACSTAGMASYDQCPTGRGKSEGYPCLSRQYRLRPGRVMCFAEQHKNPAVARMLWK